MWSFRPATMPSRSVSVRARFLDIPLIEVLQGVVQRGLVPVMAVRDEHLLVLQLLGDLLRDPGVREPVVPVLDAVRVDVSVDQRLVVPDLLVELGGESLVDAEDRFQVALHVPEEVEAVGLDLGERLLVGDDVAVLVLLGPQYADDAPAHAGGAVVVEGLLVDVERVWVLLQGAVGDPLLQLLPGSVVPLVGVRVEGEPGDVVGAGLQLLQVVGSDDVVRRGDAVADVLAGLDVRSQSGERQESYHELMTSSESNAGAVYERRGTHHSGA